MNFFALLIFTRAILVKSVMAAARSSLMSKLLLCNRCFKRSQPLLATKRFTSNNNNGPVTNARSLHANLWEEYRKRKSLIEGKNHAVCS